VLASYTATGPQVAAEPPFLQLPVGEVAGFVGSDELEVEEEEVFAAVMAWVKHDTAARKAELARLLPLVCRGTWARVTTDQFRHVALQNCMGHRVFFNIFANNDRSASR
jgi:hypothetical protein